MMSRNLHQKLSAMCLAAAMTGCGSFSAPVLPTRQPVTAQPATYFADEIAKCRLMITKTGRLNGVDWVITRAGDQTPGEAYHTLLPKSSRDVAEATLRELGLRVIWAASRPYDDFVHKGYDQNFILLRGGVSGFDGLTEGARSRNDFSLLPGKGRGEADLGAERSQEVQRGRGLVVFTAWREEPKYRMDPVKSVQDGQPAPVTSRLAYKSEVEFDVVRSEIVSGYSVSLAIVNASFGSHRVRTQAVGIQYAATAATRLAIMNIVAQAAGISPAECTTGGGSYSRKTQKISSQDLPDRIEGPDLGCLGCVTPSSVLPGPFEGMGMEGQTSLAQRILNQLGYDTGPVDGMMGPLTKSAIQRFQTDQGIYPDGVISTAVLDLLVKATRQRGGRPQDGTTQALRAPTNVSRTIDLGCFNCDRIKNSVR